MSKTYNIFISWSGARSKHVASGLRGWLPDILQTARPWMSAAEIDKGARGLDEISKALSEIKLGIVCLTPENLGSRWILYEAGCISKTGDTNTRLCTLLLGGLEPVDIKPPLGMFQHTRAIKDEIKHLIRTINRAINKEPIAERVVDKSFESSWPTLENILNSMPLEERSIDGHGIVDVYDTFPMPKFQKLLTKAKKVNILQTFLPQTIHLNALREPLIDAIKRGCQVQILICHPESPAVEIRQAALAPGCPTDVRREVCANVQTFGHIYQGLPDEGKARLEVAAYKTLPSLCIYQADDTFIYGCYFHEKLAIEAPQTHVGGRETTLGKNLCDEFHKLWDHKETTKVDLENPEIWLDSARLPEPIHD